MALTAEQRELLAEETQVARKEKRESDLYYQEFPNNRPEVARDRACLAMRLAVADHLTALEGLLKEIRAEVSGQNFGPAYLSEDTWRDWSARIAALLGPAVAEVTDAETG